MQVFTNQYTSAEVWDMQGAIIQFGNSGTLTSMPTDWNNNNTFIALGLQLAYARQITKRYPINVKKAIFLLGTPAGSLNMTLLFGPSATIQNFLTQYGGTAADAAAVASSGGDTGTSTIVIKPFGKVVASQTNQGADLGIGTWKVVSPYLSSIGLQVSESGGAQIPAIASCSMEFIDLLVE